MHCAKLAIKRHKNKWRKLKMYVQVQQAVNMWRQKSSCLDFFEELFSQYRSTNRAVSNVERPEIEDYSSQTFKNKFDQIRAGIKYIKRQNTCTSVIGYSLHNRSQLNTRVPLSVFTIESVTRNLVIICFRIP